MLGDKQNRVFASSSLEKFCPLLIGDPHQSVWQNCQSLIKEVNHKLLVCSFVGRADNVVFDVRYGHYCLFTECNFLCGIPPSTSRVVDRAASQIVDDLATGIDRPFMADPCLSRRAVNDPKLPVDRRKASGQFVNTTGHPVRIRTG
jgi:hypothetical protein